MSTKVDKPYSDIDKMLAEHDELYGDRNERLLTGRPPFLHRDRPEPPAKDPEFPYGPEPRKEWPKNKAGWTPELIKEREWWVRRFVEEEGLNFVATALRIGIHETTVGNDARRLRLKRAPVRHRDDDPRTLRRDARREQVRQLRDRGLGATEIAVELGSSPSTITQDLRALRDGIGNPKVERRDARRAEVRRLFEQNLGIPEICEQLDAAESTIRQDLRVLGLSREAQPQNLVTNRQAVAMITKALGAMEDMANLLLNLPELEILQVDEEQAQAWLQQLRRISRAGSRVRKAATKGTQT